MELHQILDSELERPERFYFALRILAKRQVARF